MNVVQMRQMRVEDALPPVPCCSCDRTFDQRDPALYREVTGWTKERKRRAAGGKPGGRNTISFAKETGRVMCERCHKLLKTTGVGQEAML